MNTGEKIDYMIQCLQVAKAEYEYSADYLANEPVGDNLRNVARMGFQVAKEVK